MIKVGLIRKIFGRERMMNPKEGNIEETLEITEGGDYITLCSRFFLSKIKRDHRIMVSSEDPSLSETDKKVFYYILPGMIIGSIHCNENCPGYTPIPVEPFRMPGADTVRCQRYTPKYMLDKGGWEGLRSSAVEYHKQYGNDEE